MKRFLLALAVTGISANAWAANIDCNKVDVASACKGYDKKPNDCLGVPTLVCPFDTEKVFCAHKHCEVGDILYADGRCYGSSLPIPKNKGTTMMPMGVVIDPEAKLAMLPIRTIASTGLAWQDVQPEAWAIGCMNRTTEGYPNATYTSSFPVPVGDNYEVSDFDINACGASRSNSEVETNLPSQQFNNGISFNWNISPLLKRIFNPLNKFTPIKSVHAASLDDLGDIYYPPILDPCAMANPPSSCTEVDPDLISYTAGCALPYIATNQDYCISYNGQGGSFYTHMLMEFKNASENMPFRFLESIYGHGLDFLAAEYCTGITGITFEETSVSVEPFLPSIADWTKVSIDGDTAVVDKITESLAQIDPDFKIVTDLSGRVFIYTGAEAVKKQLKDVSGFWTSQQAYSENGAWNSAYYVVYSGNSILPVFDTARRNSKKNVWCFINYSPRSVNQPVDNTVPDNDTPSTMASGITGNQTVAP